MQLAEPSHPSVTNSLSTTSLSGLLLLQTLHSLSKHRLELINSIAPYVEEKVLPVLKPVDKCWQPYDMLPKSEDPDFIDKVHTRACRALLPLRSHCAPMVSFCS